jgi:hypothetical protein
MDVKPVKVEGRVERRTVSAGSKSEHRAVVLTMPSGEQYVLRRKNGPAFVDPELNALVGHSIRVEGLATSGVLIMNDWRTID